MYLARSEESFDNLEVLDEGCSRERRETSLEWAELGQENETGQVIALQSLTFAIGHQDYEYASLDSPVTYYIQQAGRALFFPACAELKQYKYISLIF